MTTQRIAELEAEVLRLRSVMADVIKAHGYTGGTPIEAISIPFTPAAFNDLIEKVEKMTIERCADVQLTRSLNRHGYDKHEDSDAICALPVGQIKLEDLL